MHFSFEGLCFPQRYLRKTGSPKGNWFILHCNSQKIKTPKIPTSKTSYQFPRNHNFANSAVQISSDLSRIVAHNPASGQYACIQSISKTPTASPIRHQTRLPSFQHDAWKIRHFRQSRSLSCFCNIDHPNKSLFSRITTRLQCSRTSAACRHECHVSFREPPARGPPTHMNFYVFHE